MQLKRNGYLHQLYDFTYDNYPPDDLCTFFWRELFAVAFLPLSWLSYPFTPYNVLGRIGYTFLSWGLLFVIGGLINLFIQAPFVLLVVIVSVIGVALGLAIIAGGSVLMEEKPWKRLDPPKFVVVVKDAVTVIRESKEGFKEKYCPRIDWQ